MTKIQWFFEDDGANSWKQNLPGVSDDENRHRLKIDYLSNFQKTVRVHFNSTFFLQNNSHPDFKLIYIYFVPHYYFEWWCISEHFEITVKKNGLGPDTFFERGLCFKRHIKIGDSTDYGSVYRVTLGLSNLTGGAAPVPENSIQANELGFLADLVKEMIDSPSSYTVIT
jgi:hypothetical protein